MRYPEMGEIVHYVLPDGPFAGEERPALLIVRLHTEPVRANLVVFTDGSNDGPDYAAGAVRVAGAPHSFDRTPGSWHAAPHGGDVAVFTWGDGAFFHQNTDAGHIKTTEHATGERSREITPHRRSSLLTPQPE